VSWVFSLSIAETHATRVLGTDIPTQRLPCPSCAGKYFLQCSLMVFCVSGDCSVQMLYCITQFLKLKYMLAFEVRTHVCKPKLSSFYVV
jgi:hypothetical protein